MQAQRGSRTPIRRELLCLRWAGSRAGEKEQIPGDLRGQPTLAVGLQGTEVRCSQEGPAQAGG